MWIVLVATVLLDSMSLHGQRKACVELKLPEPWPVSRLDMLTELLLLTLVLMRPEVYLNYAENDLYDRICDMVLSSNVAVRFIRMLYGLRAFHETGRIILAIQMSLATVNVRQMLAVAILFFIGNLATFLTVRGSETWSQVVSSGFKSLVLGDSEGLSFLSNLNGGDANGIYTGVLGHLATPFFNICLLTLVTAVYSTEYANIDPISTLLFHKSRAKICTQFMLHSYGMKNLLPATCPLDLRAVGAMLVLSLAVLRVHEEGIVTLVVGMFTAACLITIQLYGYAKLMESKWNFAGENQKHHFLWICHREDFDPTAFRNAESAKEKQIEDIQGRLDQLSQANQAHKEQMAGIESTLKQILENQRLLIDQKDEKRRSRRLGSGSYYAQLDKEDDCRATAATTTGSRY